MKERIDSLRHPARKTTSGLGVKRQQMTNTHRSTTHCQFGASFHCRAGPQIDPRPHYPQRLSIRRT